MNLQVIWSYFAEKQLDEIFDYYSTKANLEIAQELLVSLINSTQLLVDNPYIGQVEELLKGRDELYRYLVYKNYKIIYSVDTDNGWIKIADVFDTRQNPVKMKRNT